MCPDGVVAYHESLSSFRPGFESRSGRWFTSKESSRTFKSYQLYWYAHFELLFFS